MRLTRTPNVPFRQRRTAQDDGESGLETEGKERRKGQVASGVSRWTTCSGVHYDGDEESFLLVWSSTTSPTPTSYG